MSVTPEAYGAVGNRTTNDTAAFQNALNTGQTVVCQSKQYRLGGSLNLTSRGGQHLNFNGAAINLVNTNYDLFNITGGTVYRVLRVPN